MFKIICAFLFYETVKLLDDKLQGVVLNGFDGLHADKVLCALGL